MEAVPTYLEVIQSKQISEAELLSEYKKLIKYKPSFEKRCFAGNPILYHYQLDNLCKVKSKKGKSFFDIMNEEEEKQYWWTKCNQYAHGSRPDNAPLRFFELWRRMNGAIVFFKPTTAMAVYKHCNATKVLDVCAGWGGRMLGAMALNIEYTGIDTNTDLQEAYKGILSLPHKSKAEILWKNALEFDFTSLEYDCVLTSPPYINLELYPHMDAWKSKDAFYKTFLIPLIDKCRKYIKEGGKVCFNISPVMYKELLSYNYPKCVEELNMLQQKVRGIDKRDKIYIWNKLES
jgi:hypothetical protein